MVQFRRIQASDPQDPAIEIRLNRAELEVLNTIAPRLRSILTHPDESACTIRRLFPITHENPLDELEHRELIGQNLYDRRRECLDLFQKTLDRYPRGRRKGRIRLTAGESDLWLHVINDLRLVLGTHLNIRENEWESQWPEDPAARADHGLLQALSMVQELLLAALME